MSCDEADSEATDDEPPRKRCRPTAMQRLRVWGLGVYGLGFRVWNGLEKTINICIYIYVLIEKERERERERER